MQAPAIELDGAEGGSMRPVRSPYIVGPWFDHGLIIWTPLAFLGIAALIEALDAKEVIVPFWPERRLRLFESMAVTVMFAHLFATVFRSHLNGHFLRARLSRTTIGPLIVGVVLYLSETAWYVFPILVVWFDVWHSSLQTFGFGRMYDARLGNDVELGRWWDKGLAILVYAGPIVAGLNAFWYFNVFSRADVIAEGWGTAFAEAVTWRGLELAWLLGLGGGVYLGLYLWWYARRARAGHRISRHKILLYVSLTVTTVAAFGFNAFDQAFLITESFHAVQYLAILTWAETPSLSKKLGVAASPLGKVLPAVVILGCSLLAGLWVAAHWNERTASLIVLVVGAVHYWCDGFIWSVRKGDI